MYDLLNNRHLGISGLGKGYLIALRQYFSTYLISYLMKYFQPMSSHIALYLMMSLRLETCVAPSVELVLQSRIDDQHCLTLDPVS